MLIEVASFILNNSSKLASMKTNRSLLLAHEPLLYVCKEIGDVCFFLHCCMSRKVVDGFQECAAFQAQVRLNKKNGCWGSARLRLATIPLQDHLETRTADWWTLCLLARSERKRERGGAGGEVTRGTGRTVIVCNCDVGAWTHMDAYA